MKIINYRLNNIRFNEKKDLFFLNLAKETRGDVYYNESVNIQLKPRDMTKIYNYLNSLKNMEVYCGTHYICGCFTKDGKPIEGVGMKK